MPYPTNLGRNLISWNIFLNYKKRNYNKHLETALEVEHEVRSNGAIPATIGFLNGKMKVGLTKNEIEILAKNHDRAIKLSRRDLAFVFGNKNVIGGKY